MVNGTKSRQVSGGGEIYERCMRKVSGMTDVSLECLEGAIFLFERYGRITPGLKHVIDDCTADAPDMSDENVKRAS